ncbi:MAG: hypothetical protein PWP48_1605 [Clostridiales bacterium]|nr:hypothetical protein [Clostridiales bacterium]
MITISGSKTPSFVLTLKLDTQKYQEDILDKRLEIGRQIYNACLGKALKRYKAMTESKQYRLIQQMTKSSERNHQLGELQKQYKLTQSDIDAYVAPMQHKFKDNIDSHTAQKLAERALAAVEKLIYSKAKQVHFKKIGQDISLEGKANNTGIKYRDGHILWNGLKIPVIIKPGDEYACLAIQSRIKYCRIYKRYTGNKYKYYVQLILEGIPPLKEIKVGQGDVGIDAGTQTAAIVADNEVMLVELSPQTKAVDKEIIRLQRKLDRSRRATNPDNFNPDGTIKKGIKHQWIKSKKYTKTQLLIKDRYRKRAGIRRQSHNKLANHILSLGSNIKAENMDYEALQRRAKETTINQKTGRYNKKGRFGKSLANKAPAMLITIIDTKLNYFGLKLIKIKPKDTKASQYNHVDDEYTKKELSQRWNEIMYKGGIRKIQRDLYSAFLLQNAEKDENTGKYYIDRDKCIDRFDGFLELHDKEIERLRGLKKEQRLISSMGI